MAFGSRGKRLFGKLSVPGWLLFIVLYIWPRVGDALDIAEIFSMLGNLGQGGMATLLGLLESYGWLLGILWLTAVVLWPERRPKLEILWKPTEPKHWMFYGDNNLTFHYRLCVSNRSEAKTVKGVEVKLERIDPDELDCAPCLLLLMNDTRPPGDKRPHRESFDLKPHGEQFVDLMAQDPDGDHLYIWHIVGGIEQRVPARSYTLRVSARAIGAKDGEMELEVFRNGPYWHLREITPGAAAP